MKIIPIGHYPFFLSKKERSDLVSDPAPIPELLFRTRTGHDPTVSGSTPLVFSKLNEIIVDLKFC